MAEEPSHKAMLYFVEVLMNTNGALTISQLAGRFGSRSFTPEMRTAAGANEVGLKKFLLKYPSLFTVSGNMVSLFDSSKASSTSSAGDGGDVSEDGVPPARALPDVSAEMEASQYFQYKLIKKEERWVPIRGLAGHLSQASANVRNVVGPQLDFRKWLLRHPHIFEVQGDLVGLRDGVAAVATPTIPRRAFAMAANGADVLPPSTIPLVRMPPKTPPPQRRQPPKTPPAIRRSHSFSEKRVQQLEEVAAAAHPRPLSQEISSAVSAMPTTPGARRRNAPVTMTANEYKAVMFLKDIVEKRGGIKIHNITGHFSQAAEGVRNTIGWTKMELEEFLRKNANVFSVSEDEVVNVNKNAKLNVIITGSRPSGASIRTLTGRKGKVFHVAKLWGIIDLGKHEHVFFDKSIMKRPLDDLSKEFHVNEMLCFNAVLAPKTSRAKWRATHVWKEHEQQPSAAETEIGFQDNDEFPMSPATSIEEEINRFLPKRDKNEGSGSSSKYGDAAPSAAGVVPVWGVGGAGGDTGGDTVSNSSGGGVGDDNVSMMSESSYMTSSTVDDLRLLIPKYTGAPSCNGAGGAGVTIMAASKVTKDTEAAVGAAGDNVASAKEAAAAAVTKLISPRVTTAATYMPPPPPTTTTAGAVTTREMACQTISTGEIIATQLYQE